MPLESLSGYLTALGQENQIRTLSAFISVLFPHTSSVIAAMADVSVQAATLAATTAQAPADLVALTVTGLAQRFGCSTYPWRLSNFLAGALARHLRYCPGCLAHDGVRRLLWRFVWIEGCAAHHCALVERCPHCDYAAPLLASPFSLTRCSHCGANLCETTMTALTARGEERTRRRSDDLARLLAAPASTDHSRCGVDAALIGGRLAQLRVERGWTRDEVAMRLGVPAYDVGAIENTRTTGARRLQLYLRYADLLDVECSVLVGAPPRDGATEAARTSGAGVRRRRPVTIDAVAGWMGLHPNALLLLMTLLRAQAWEMLVRVWKAVRMLNANELDVTQAAVSRLLGVAPSTLRDAPGVHALLTLTTKRVGRRV